MALQQAITYTQRRLGEDKATGLVSDEITVNFGPQHPSTHGVLRLIVTLDGERIVKVEPVFGYLHRCHEKLAENLTYLQNTPYTDRLDYLCSMANNFGYALAVEKLAGDIQVPERAEYIRVIMAELTRYLNHIAAIGFMLNDMGAFFTPFLYAMEKREKILDLFEAASGSRMMCNYIRYGGVAHDLPDGWVEALWKLIPELYALLDELDAYVTNNEIVKARAQGVGVLPPDVAVAYSATGPVLRASGVPYDIRRAEPYSIYDRFDFEVITEEAGDVYARYLVRLREAYESLKIVEQALKDLPEGPVMAKLPRMFKPPKGAAYGRVESPKGELGWYLVSDGTGKPYRYHVRSPGLINMTAFDYMCRGHLVADMIVILGSVDIVMGEVDR